MSGLWDKPGIPHKGWVCCDVIDLRASDDDNDSDQDSDDLYESCEMCDHERVRYIHIMEHIDYHCELRVGCVCAGKMSGDYAGAKQRETDLKNRATRRAKWLHRKWHISAKGNPYLKLNDHILGVYPDHYKQNRWRFHIDQYFSTNDYGSEKEAKLALFDSYNNMII